MIAEADFLSLSALLGRSPWGQQHNQGYEGFNKVTFKTEKVHNFNKDQFGGMCVALCGREKKKRLLR